MAKSLSSWFEAQLQRGAIRHKTKILIEGIDRSAYLMRLSVSLNREFGSASANVLLNNTDAGFTEGGSREINLGDSVEIIEESSGDSTEWPRFYGFVVQRSRQESSTTQQLELVCLDFISKLQSLDIDMEVEGTKVAVSNEVLTPNFLPPPNSSLAQIFNFSKAGLADRPLPVILIHDLTNDTNHPQADGFEVLYEQGQLKLGSPINAFTNYEIIARSYSYYVTGVYAEDILEDILILPDTYDNRLFGAETESEFITNHLTETFQNVEGSINDTLAPNLTASTIEIRHVLTASVAIDDATINVDSTSGFPTSGQAEISGDIFTWTGKTSTTLTGCSGLKSHASGDIVIYEATYAAGQLWYLTYSNIQTVLVSGDFTGIPSGITLDHFDARFGRIILSATIPTTTTVECTNNYTFKTLQASGVQLNRISFRSRELENRYEAVEKLRKYLAPNYLIRTIGTNKIWSGYITQRTTPHYILDMIKDINYLDDEDQFTRVIFFGRNNNPTNVMFSPDVDFVSTGVSFKDVATDNELSLVGEEGNYYVYGTVLSGVGYIDSTTITPVVKINGIAIDNQVHQLFQQPVLVELTTQTETRTGCHGVSKEQYFKSHSYFYYKVYFSHTNIYSGQPIDLHNQNGTTLVTISANDPNMDYAHGVWHVPGNEENTTITQLASASYYVIYAANFLIIDYDRILFKIDKTLITQPLETIVTATYEYFAVFTNVFDVAAIIDGRFDTQVQTEFFSEPPSGLPFAIIDLGDTYNLQAIDIVAGFFRPDLNRKFDIDMRFSLKYSLDNVDYFDISDRTSNIKLTGGDNISFEEDDLGSGFQARYLRIDLQFVKRIDFGEQPRWVVAFTEMAAYNNIIISGDASLIPTTQLTSDVSHASTTINVVSTEEFDEASGGAPVTAYIEEDSFTYTGKTSTSFTGVAGLSSSHTSGARVHETIESDTTLYDDDGLLPKFSERVYKDNLISDSVLYSQAQLDSIAKSFLKEFYKQHTRRSVELAFAPYINIGHTVELPDGLNYFVEAVETDSSGNTNLVVARYP